MERRAPRTCYYLNRKLRYLALIARDVRLPASIGVWIPIANPELAPSETMELIASAHPTVDVRQLSVITLLSAFDVDEFEDDLRQRGLLRASDGAAETDES
jgi:hypothetical protein